MNTAPEPARLWRVRGRELALDGGLLMGVVNVTPDSFSDGGVNLDPHAAIASGLAMREAGAGIIDVGGESTRPGAEPVPVDEELRRVLPVIGGLVAEGVIVSIDTTKPEVAEAALDQGASIVNDVSACSTSGMSRLVASWGAGVVLMHAKGTPQTMQHRPEYDDVVAEVVGFLEERVSEVTAAGVDTEAIAIDPGIGFGKTVRHNLELIAGIGALALIGRPVVLGASRKSFLGALTGIEIPADRDGVTAVTTGIGYRLGARVFRVHDVESSRDALRLAAAIVAPERWEEWLQG